MNEDCAQNMMILIPKGMKIPLYFSYLSGKCESSCRASCKSQVDGVKC
jgi:hypothetical protein